MQPIRIQKALSEAGVASRRAAEELVRQGRVTINGRKAEIGQSVNPDRDVIAVDGKRVFNAREAMCLPEQPKSLACIGAGAIGMEFGYFYQANESGYPSSLGQSDSAAGVVVGFCV